MSLQDLGFALKQLLWSIYTTPINWDYVFFPIACVISAVVMWWYLKGYWRFFEVITRRLRENLWLALGMLFRR